MFEIGGVGMVVLVALLTVPAVGLAAAPIAPATGTHAPPWLAWSPTVAVSGGSAGAGFALDSAGRARVLASAGGVLHYAWSDGLQWHDQTVGIGEYVNTDHSLAFDQSGVLHAVVSTDPHTANGGSLLFGTLASSGSWTFERLLSASPNVPIGMRNRLLFDPSGLPHILYQEWSAHARIKHAYRDANGWHVEQVDADVAGNQSATVDAQGRLQICYDISGPAGVQEMYAIRSPAVGWTRAILDSGGGGACGLAFDPQGDLHVAYVGPAGVARHAIHRATGWSYDDIQTGPATATDLAIDATGRVHVAVWERNAGLSYSTLDTKGAWTKETVDVNDSGGSPRILVDAQGRPQIAYLHHRDQVDAALGHPDSIDVATPLLARVAGAAGL